MGLEYDMMPEGTKKHSLHIDLYKEFSRFYKFVLWIRSMNSFYKFVI